MPLLDVMVFIASLYMLNRSYLFLVDREKPHNLARDAEWELGGGCGL